ncbi:hypothetical protein FACS1894130_11030 [Spirochaetia bacterium]|nr:hypothetical protein FACS1894130_11030 [Spirochaetia bacterium]
MHKNGGKPPKLTSEDKLYIALKYLRQYRTMDSVAVEYGVCKGTVCLAIQWVEDTSETKFLRLKTGRLSCPGKKR